MGLVSSDVKIIAEGPEAVREKAQGWELGFIILCAIRFFIRQYKQKDSRKKMLWKKIWLWVKTIKSDTPPLF